MSPSKPDRADGSDLQRHYTGYLLVATPSAETASALKALSAQYSFLRSTSKAVEVEYQGRDSSRVVVKALREVARVVGDADGEVRCAVEGDTDQLQFEFYRVRGGILYRQRGEVTRGPEEPIDDALEGGRG